MLHHKLFDHVMGLAHNIYSVNDCQFLIVVASTFCCFILLINFIKVTYDLIVYEGSFITCVCLLLLFLGLTNMIVIA